MKQKARADQQATIDELYASFAEGHQKVIIQRPTGYGKTTTSALVIEREISEERRCWFLVHRKELADQAFKRFHHQGLRVGLLTGEVTARLDAPVVVASKDVMWRRLSQLEKRHTMFVDEAQHIAAPTWGACVEWHMDSVSPRLIGVSATPWDTEGQPLPFFTKLLGGVPPRSMIGEGLPLCDAEVWTGPTPDLGAVAQSEADFNRAALEAAYKGLDAPIVETWLKRAKGKRTICFASSVDHSLALTETWNKLGFKAAHIDWETPPQKRRDIIRAFSDGQILILSNYALITEGFDVPAAEVVVLARATRSETLYVQMAGRALRAHLDKKRAIILDHGRNVMRFGDPLADRPGSLINGRPKPIKEEDLDKGAVDPALGIQVCHVCLGVSKAGKQCSLCGAIMVPPKLPKHSKVRALEQWIKTDTKMATSADDLVARKRAAWKLLQDVHTKKGVHGIFKAIGIYKDLFEVRPHEDGILSADERTRLFSMISAASKRGKK